MIKTIDVELEIVDSIQMLICNIITVQTTISVPTSRSLPVNHSAESTNVTWTDWAHPNVTADPLLNQVSSQDSSSNRHIELLFVDRASCANCSRGYTYYNE